MRTLTVLIMMLVVLFVGLSIIVGANEVELAPAFAVSAESESVDSSPKTNQPTSTTQATIDPPLATTTTQPPTTTTTLIDRADPIQLRIPSIDLEVPIDAVGPRFGNDEWYPAGDRVEWYASTELVGPGEIGPAFILGHSNWSRKRNEGNAFFDLFDAERYDNDSSVAENDQIFIDLADGNNCSFVVIDARKYADLPGLPLALSPGKYLPKLVDWTFNTYQIIDATAGISRIYLFGSYPGVQGNEYEKYPDGSIHAVYAAYVAADLVECTEQAP